MGEGENTKSEVRAHLAIGYLLLAIAIGLSGYRRAIGLLGYW
jgi:hypothetical protein